jgi:hypothetical protein
MAAKSPKARHYFRDAGEEDPAETATTVVKTAVNGLAAFSTLSALPTAASSYPCSQA